METFVGESKPLGIDSTADLPEEIQILPGETLTWGFRSTPESDKKGEEGY